MESNREELKHKLKDSYPSSPAEVKPERGMRSNK